MTARIFIKLILAVVCVLAVALTAVDYLVTQRVQQTQFDGLRRELEQKARIIALSGALAGPIRDLVVNRLGHRPRERALAGSPDRRPRASPIPTRMPRRWKTTATVPKSTRHWRAEWGPALRVSRTFGTRFFYVAIPLNGGQNGNGAFSA